MFKRITSAGTAAQKSSKSSLLARLPLLLAILLLCAVSGCDSHKADSTPPSWVHQNIDSEDACNIILCNNIKLMKVGNSYTATYTFADTKTIYYKVNKKENANDFGFANWGIEYFDDSCKLKEDLRVFVKLQMVKYISDHFKADSPQ
jgi:hypothetical protein